MNQVRRYHELPVPAGHSPLRRPNSLRRTSSIDTTWPDGRDSRLRFHGVARDRFTSVGGGARRVLDRDDKFAIIAADIRLAAEQKLGTREVMVGAVLTGREGGYAGSTGPRGASR